MIAWLSSNIGTILVSLLLILVVAFIVRGIIRDKKAGRHSCGGGSCGCGGSCGSCGHH